MKVVSGCCGDFAMFPELFNAPLMVACNDRTEAEAIRLRSGHIPTIRDQRLAGAVKYNANVITGSMHLMDDGRQQNVGFLCG